MERGDALAQQTPDRGLGHRDVRGARFPLRIAIAYLYAAIRPRMGAGPATATCAGLMLWSIVGLFGLLGNLPLGIFPLGLLFTGVAAALPAYVVAGLVAGWLYREEETARAS